MLYLLLITLQSLTSRRDDGYTPEAVWTFWGRERYLASLVWTFWWKYNRLQWKCPSTVC